MAARMNDLPPIRILLAEDEDAMRTYLARALAAIGTAAMLWVGGNIITHGLDVLGVHEPYATIHHWAEVAGQAVPAATGFAMSQRMVP